MTGCSGSDGTEEERQDGRLAVVRENIMGRWIVTEGLYGGTWQAWPEGENILVLSEDGLVHIEGHMRERLNDSSEGTYYMRDSTAVVTMDWSMALFKFVEVYGDRMTIQAEYFLKETLHLVRSTAWPMMWQDPRRFLEGSWVATRRRSNRNSSEPWTALWPDEQDIAVGFQGDYMSVSAPTLEVYEGAELEPRTVCGGVSGRTSDGRRYGVGSTEDGSCIRVSGIRYNVIYEMVRQ